MVMMVHAVTVWVSVCLCLCYVICYIGYQKRKERKGKPAYSTVLVLYTTVLVQSLSSTL